MRSILGSVLVLCTAVAVSSLAHAQAAPAGAAARPPTTAELATRLAALEAEIAELRAAAAGQPELEKTLGALAAQVAVLRQDVDALARGAAGQGDLVARVDALETQLGLLGEQVAGLRADTAAAHGPESVGQGGGGGHYKGGFRLVDDGVFSLRVGGYAQLRYLGQVNEDGSVVEESGFSLRRARFTVDGTAWSPRLGYKMMLEVAGGVAGLDFFIEGKLPHGFFVRGGQFKVPMSRDFMSSAGTLSFVERPVATDELRYDRDIGVWGGWRGHDGRVEAGLGVFNGAGKNVKKNDNIDPLVVVRVEATPLGTPWKAEEGDLLGTAKPSLALGASFSFENAPAPDPVELGVTDGGDFFDVDGDGDRDNVAVWMVALDAAFRWKGLGVETELYIRGEDYGAIAEVPTVAPADRHVGWFAQASYFVLPGRLQVGARYGETTVTPLVLGGRSHAVPSEADHRREASLLVAYYRFEHGTELSAMYSFLDWYDEAWNDVPGAAEQRVIVETQVSW